MENKTNTERCSSEGLKLLGDYWSLRIIDALHEDELRFCQLEKILTDINTATLTKRLRQLELSGIIKREHETIDKQSVTYLLSEAGLGLLPILKEIKRFTETHPSIKLA